MVRKIIIISLRFCQYSIGIHSIRFLRKYGLPKAHFVSDPFMVGKFLNSRWAHTLLAILSGLIKFWGCNILDSRKRFSAH